MSFTSAVLNLLAIEIFDRSIQTELDNYQQQPIASLVFAGGTLPILLASWTLVLSAVRDYIRDRQAAAAMAVSRTELIQAKDRLNQEVETRLQQEQQIRVESELLQSDVAHILDVVCSLEEGDLTVQARVNERATGLVSDTLNRSIESLDRIVSAVVDTAQQVTTDAGQLAQAAIETTHQAQSQAIEVRSVQLLMDNINALTADSRQQAIETAIAVQQAKSAVVSGKAAIESTTDGIETLQQGTVQIIKRSELLTEFVDLAAQFSKDQKRVAALTRVLALNVSTLSSRAIQERDPEKFASLAKEFEAIALQVNTLATDTNDSLASLQQRTDRVQTVTSGLTQDISDIDRASNALVDSLDNFFLDDAEASAVSNDFINLLDDFFNDISIESDEPDVDARSIGLLALELAPILDSEVLPPIVADNTTVDPVAIKRIQIPVPLERLDKSAQQVVETLLTARAVTSISTQLHQLTTLTRENSQFVTRLRQLQDDYALIRNLSDEQQSGNNVTIERYRQGYTTIVRLLENILRLSELGQEIESSTYQSAIRLEALDRSILQLKDGIETSRLVAFRNLTLRAKAILRDLTNRYGDLAI